jgi:alpha-ketoglutarate-dependent taurine dioxygenase
MPWLRGSPGSPVDAIIELSGRGWDGGAGMMISIRSLDAALGAEVTGVDASKSLPQADIDAIEAAWRERLVVVLHDQELSDPQLIAFSKNFGELDPPGPNPMDRLRARDRTTIRAQYRRILRA